MLRNLRRPKGLANSIILVVAEGDEYRSLVQGSCIEVFSDTKLDYEAKKLARKIGLPRPVMGGDRYSKNEEKGLEFAESIDKILESSASRSSK